MYVENLLFNPMRLLERAKNIKGIYWLTDISSINEQYNLAQEIAEEWTDDWSEDDGFGSSDFTFALKDFIDEFIRRKKLPLKTVFEPYLEIVKC
jgi:hypothetical protein